MSFEQLEPMVRYLILAIIIYAGTRLGIKPITFKYKIFYIFVISLALFLLWSLSFQDFRVLVFIVIFIILFVVAGGHHLMVFHGNKEITFCKKESKKNE